MYKIQPKTLFIGKSGEYLPICHSTNDFLQQLLQEGKPENGHLVYTGYQTNGRGQRGNSWEAIAGENILMSILLKPIFLKAASQFQLNMAISLGILAGIKEQLAETENILAESLKIKWPNDIYFGNKKLGGILIENSILGNNLSTSIIGIGLNINQINFDIENAISLATVLKQKFDTEKVIKIIAEKIEKYYLLLKNEYCLENEYLASLFRLNEFHNFRKRGLIFTGKITGIDTFGRLIIEVENAIQVFDFKEVEFVI